MENQKKLLQFIEWIGANVPELQGQDSEQIISTINKLSETPEGQKILQKLIEGFESNATGMFKKGGKLNYLLCLKNGGIADCGCGKKLKAEDGDILSIPATPEKSRKIGFEPRYIGLRIEPLGNYRESNTNIRTGLEDPGRMWTRLQSRSAGPVTQIKYENESYNNPARTYDTRVNPNPNESANQYIERWRTLDNILKQEGLLKSTDPGITTYRAGGQTNTEETQTATTKIKPETKPRGLRGIVWEPKKYPRVDFYDNLDGDFTGTRSWYIDPKGTEHQILEKKFPAGNTATTELKITPDRDSTMIITNSQGINKVKDMSKFLPAFKKNF